MINYIGKIKEIRVKSGMTQEEVAKVIGVSRPTYASIEAGKQELSLEEAQKFVEHFNLSIDFLLTGNLPDINKYKQMILAFLRSDLSRDGKVPKTKLAKLLYLADFSWYYDNLNSMSGMPYRKITYGPVPDMIFRALDELEESGKILIERKPGSDGKEAILIKEVDSNSNQKLNEISDKEKKRISEVAIKWKNKTTNDIVNFTHNQLPYFLCRENQVIPYSLITQEDPDKVF
jgi:DNA-binding XRE family transcriptional regulator/uncharacterized phage-associated protein